MLGLSKKLPHFSIDFIKIRKASYALSLLLLTSVIFSFTFCGVNEGIDFHGGTIIEMRFSQPTNLSLLREKTRTLAPGASLQTFGDKNTILFKTANVFDDPEKRIRFVSRLTDSLPDHPTVRRIESIGPKVGHEAVWNALFATFMALIFMLIYVWLRFDWHYGLCAILALIHDATCVLGLYTLGRVEFNFTSIVAILITIGYSINDTVVIYDRIRDHAHQDGSETALINKAINASLSRTILTSLSTIVSLCALYFFGGPVISTYSLPILIGVVVGTYSSIFIAAPLLYSFNAPIKRELEQDVTALPEQHEL